MSLFSQSKHETTTANTDRNTVGGTRLEMFAYFLNKCQSQAHLKKGRIPAHWRDGWYLNGKTEVGRKSFIIVREHYITPSLCWNWPL